jgi:transposase-like protein
MLNRTRVKKVALPTGEIAAHFDEVSGAKVSKDTISRITEKVSSGLAK